MRRSLVFLAAPLLVLFFISSAFAPTDPIPHMINYQGMLTNDEGTPLNGLYDLTFRIYDVPSGGTALWTENYNDEEVLDGLFNVILEIPASVFNGPDRYMGITVWPDAELTPRTRLTSVGYAYVAETAVTSGTDGDWTTSDNDIYSAVSGNVGIGTTSPDYKLEISSNLDVFRAGTENAWIEFFAGGNSRLGFGDGDGFEAGFISGNENGSGENVLAIAGCDDAGNCPSFTYFHEDGNVGIGTFSPSEKLEVNGNIELSGVIKGRVPGIEYSNASGLGTQTSLSTSWLTLKSVSVTHPGDGYVICIGTGHVDWDQTNYTGNILAGWTTSSSGTPVSYNRTSLSVADGTTYIPMTAIHTFIVSGSGTTTFYFRARIDASGTMDFFEGSVAAMYFPTKY